MTCPWAGWAPPTQIYCEEVLCGWVTTPSNSWSNISFILVAFWLARTIKEPRLRAFVPAAVILGVASFLFHASHTYAFQVLDNAAMFVIPALAAGLLLERRGWVRWPGRAAAAVAATATLLMMTFARLGWPTPMVMGLLVGWVMFLEWRRWESKTDIRWLLAALGLFGASFGVWILDYQRLWCDPGNHFLQGHALWHVGSAAAIGLLYRHYRQFEEKSPA